jgi:hypothetical protein
MDLPTSGITREHPSQADKQAGAAGAACDVASCPTAEQGGEAPVSLATRTATVLIAVEIVVFAAIGENWLPELGLAFIAGGTLLATPSLIAPLVASNKFFAVYLRIVAILAAIAVILAVLGVRGGHINIADYSSLEFIALMATAVAELILLAIVPLWFWTTTREALSSPGNQRSTAPHARTWHGRVEDKRVFAQLGALLFMAGVLMQFIAGSGPPEALHHPQIATHESKSDSH